jgi:hypothetical protein
VNILWCACIAAGVWVVSVCNLLSCMLVDCAVGPNAYKELTKVVYVPPTGLSVRFLSQITSPHNSLYDVCYLFLLEITSTCFQQNVS